MKVVVVGRGRVGGGLADRWQAAGHEVVRLGRAGGSAARADALLLAVPSDAITAALRRVDDLDGRPLLDATNAYAGRDERFASLAHEAKAVTGGPVAKALNLQYAALHGRLDEQHAPPSDLCAADPEARGVAERLVRDAGYDPIFVGGLEHARTLEDATALFRQVRMGLGPYFHRYAAPGPPGAAT